MPPYVFIANPDLSGVVRPLINARNLIWDVGTLHWVPLTEAMLGGESAEAIWGDITGTLADQTDLQTALDGKADTVHVHAQADVTNLVSALAGKASTSHTHAISDVTNLQSSLDGKASTSHNHDSAYQPLDSDLTTIAGLTATTDNFMVAASSAWASRTPAQAKTALALAKGDVGLGNVDNTSDASKPVSTATQTALDLKAVINNPTFTGTTVTLANAQDLVINATTGTKIGQSGSKVGFFGVTPVVRPSALTQTYSTASATHAAVTQLAAPAGGTGTAAGGWSTAANRDLAITSINAARTDIANLKNFVNQIVDQLQALGLLQ